MNNTTSKHGRRSPVRTLPRSRNRAGTLFRSLSAAGIGLKITLFACSLLIAGIGGISLIATEIMDEALLRSLIQRGSAIASSAAIPSESATLADDRPALAELAARLRQSQDDLDYVAFFDRAGTLLAESRLAPASHAATGAKMLQIEGPNGFTVRRLEGPDGPCFEISAPFFSAGSRIGAVTIGLDSRSLLATQRSIRLQLLLLGGLALLGGAAMLQTFSSLLTRQVKRLNAGVSRIRSGDCDVALTVTSRDELGALTVGFNRMARVLNRQRKSLQSYSTDLENAYLSTVRILAAALDARDNYTYGHSARVARLAQLLGQRMGLDGKSLKELEMGCFLHDIGKIRVPDSILNKDAPLDDAETEVIRRHPAQGADILYLAESLHKFIPVVLQHHEWHDGSGYPRGLKGDRIHLHARIVAIADAYDAMTTSRPYRQGLSRSEAVEEIRSCSGSQFGPQLVELFIAALADYREDEDLPFLKGAA